MTDKRTLILRILGASIIIAFLVYGAIEARGLVFGPVVTLTSPEEGATVEEPLISLRGNAVRTKSLTANGNPVLIDLEGNFTDYLVLSPGYNIMTIVATDARGTQKTTTRHLYYKKDIPFNARPVDDISSSTSATTTQDAKVTASTTNN